jgi:hypothetical protein
VRDGACVPGPAVVLLEGRSDVAAVSAVAATLGGTGAGHDVRLVDMGGVTNVRRHLSALAAGPPVRVAGLCDAGEAHVVARALGVDADAAALAERGFFVCEADLEDELIRAAGPQRVLDVLDRLGLRARFATFQHQQVWRGRLLHAQLHRFAGIASGRKAVFAGALAADLAPDEVPVPLRRLVALVTEDP